MEKIVSRTMLCMFDNAVNIILQEYFSINKIFLKEIFNNLVKKFGWPDILKNDASFWPQEVMLVTFWSCLWSFWMLCSPSKLMEMCINYHFIFMKHIVRSLTCWWTLPCMFCSRRFQRRKHNDFGELCSNSLHFTILYLLSFWA